MQNAAMGGMAGWMIEVAMTQPGVEAGETPGAAQPAATADKQVVPLGAPGVTSQPTTTPAVPGTTGGTGGGAPAPSSMMTMFLPILAVFVLMIVMTSMSGRKEKKKRAALLSAIKKHDKVQTMGGVIGTIAEIDGDEVVLRLDEGRMRVSRGAIQTVLRESKSRANGTIEEKDRSLEKIEA